MKTIFSLLLISMLLSCNNAKKESEKSEQTTTTPSGSTTSSSTNTVPGAGSLSFTVANGEAKTFSASVLVQKDKDKLSPGNDYIGVTTANGPDGESFVVNYVFALKPGVYPVVGLSLSRGKEVYGGILGGNPKITPYKVNLTECSDLGSNNMGGHKWKISGNVEGEVTIDAMGIMKMDKEHPADIKVRNISFSDLTFDDNWEQLMEEGMKKLEESKK